MRKHKELLTLRDEAQARGCWCSVANILEFEGEDMPRRKRDALRDARRNLMSLAQQALEFAEEIASIEEALWPRKS